MQPLCLRSCRWSCFGSWGDERRRCGTIMAPQIRLPEATATVLREARFVFVERAKRWRIIEKPKKIWRRTQVDTSRDTSKRWNKCWERMPRSLTCSRITLGSWLGESSELCRGFITPFLPSWRPSWRGRPWRPCCRWLKFWDRFTNVLWAKGTGRRRGS